MRVSTQYHLTKDEAKALEALSSNRGRLYDDASNLYFFGDYADEISVLCSDSTLVTREWSERGSFIEITKHGRKALDKYPAPHTIEIEIATVADEEDEAD